MIGQIGLGGPARRTPARCTRLRQAGLAGYVVILLKMRVSRRLAQEYGREPNSKEIGKRMGLPPEKVREIVKVAQLPLSLEAPIGEEDSGGEVSQNLQFIVESCYNRC